MSQVISRKLQLKARFSILFFRVLFSCTLALVTRRPYCPGGPKKLCFTTLSLIPMVSIARLSVVKQSFFGPPGQYGRRVTRTNCLNPPPCTYFALYPSGQDNTAFRVQSFNAIRVNIFMSLRSLHQNIA